MIQIGASGHPLTSGSSGFNSAPHHKSPVISNRAFLFFLPTQAEFPVPASRTSAGLFLVPSLVRGQEIYSPFAKDIVQGSRCTAHTEPCSMFKVLHFEL